jgi:hypothetical protein
MTVSVEMIRKLLEETEETLGASRNCVDSVQKCLDRTSAAIDISECVLYKQPKRNRRKNSRRAEDRQ